MVQVLRRTVPTFGEQFAGGFEKGFERESELQKMIRQNDLEQKTKKEQMTQALSRAESIYSNPNLSQEQKIFGLHRELSQNPQLAKSILGSIQETKEPSLTPYQKEQIKQKGAHLELQERKLTQAREKGRKELPQMVAHFTKSYAKDLMLQPDDKIALDKLVHDNFNQGMDLNEALSAGVEQLAQKREAVDSLTNAVPNRPFGADHRAQAKTQAMQNTAMLLKQAYAGGAIAPRQITELLKNKGWKNPEISQILDFVFEGDSVEQSPQEPSRESERFDSSNPNHVARAKEVLAQAGGDRAKANAILSQEFLR